MERCFDSIVIPFVYRSRIPWKGLQFENDNIHVFFFLHFKSPFLEMSSMQFVYDLYCSWNNYSSFYCFVNTENVVKTAHRPIDYHLHLNSKERRCEASTTKQGTTNIQIWKHSHCDIFGCTLDCNSIASNFIISILVLMLKKDERVIRMSFYLIFAQPSIHRHTWQLPVRRILCAIQVQSHIWWFLLTKLSKKQKKRKEWKLCGKNKFNKPFWFCFIRLKYEQKFGKTDEFTFELNFKW